MGVKKKYNMHFQTRGSNHKYSQLDNLDELKKLLWLHCPADVAKMLDVPYNSVRYRIEKYLTPEEQERINWKRARHQNKLHTK